MTQVNKGCPFAGCNVPEGECDGACLRVLKFTVLPVVPIEEAIAQRAAPEREDNPLLCEILGFLNDLTHPEQYGHAVTAEVRKRARELATAIETAEGML